LTLIIPSLIARRHSLLKFRSFLILQSSQPTELELESICHAKWSGYHGFGVSRWTYTCDVHKRKTKWSDL